MCFAPQRRALFRNSTSEPPKVVRTPSVFNILTWKCTSRHNGVHFFDISTSKSGPDLVCFVHFHLEMCFAPQRRALFRHLNFQKWSGAGVFCTFWLGNVLRTTTACTFSTSQLPKVVRTWCVLCILTWKCASRHNGVHFFISHLASWLRTRRFSEPTFRPSGATNHWKNTVNRDVPTFSRICIFFLLTLSLLIFFLLIFSLLTLLTSAFQLSILSEVSLLNFLWLLLLLSLSSSYICNYLHTYLLTTQQWYTSTWSMWHLDAFCSTGAMVIWLTIPQWIELLHEWRIFGMSMLSHVWTIWNGTLQWILWFNE